MRADPFLFVLAPALIAVAGCGGGQPSTPPAETAEPTELAAVADLADLEIPNAAMPIPDVLVGGQPTQAQLESAAALGVRTIVDLRPEGEIGMLDTKTGWRERGVVEHLGMRYVPIPVVLADDFNAENARRLAEVLDAPDALPAIVHCANGNRVGALLALKAAWVDGAPTDAALELGRAAGMTRHEKTVREKLAAEPAR